MCFFDSTQWKCGYWKWDSFRGQCNKEHRMGETCGLKLNHTTKQIDVQCKLCDQVAKKQRRVNKMAADVRRWHKEGNRWATIEKTQADMGEIMRQIQDLEWDHQERVTSL